MNKDFIPHEQALELKELGFDDECVGYYSRDMDGKYYLFTSSTDNTNRMEKYNPNVCLAPLYQQAFRWFRDVHGLNGVIEGSKKHGFEWCIFPDLDYYMKPPNNFNTYEEAEMACLRRLIEVVKEKK